MAKLPNYVKKTALFAMMAGVGGLWVLQLIFAYLAQLESLSDSYQMQDVFWYIFYKAPYFLVQFAPTGVLLGAVVGLGLLANHSEIVVMRSAGVSLYRIVGWVMQPAVLFVLMALAVNQWVLPVANHHAKNINSTDTSLVSISGYWVVAPRADDTNVQEVVYVGYADTEGKLKDVKRFDVADGTLLGAMSAPTGYYDDSQTDRYQWQLQDVDTIWLNNHAIKQDSAHQAVITLPISKESVHLLTKAPEDLAITELYQHSKLMRHQDSRSLRHELAFWQKVLSPFAVLSLVLIACSFVFGSLRSQSLGLRIVMALLTGLLFSYAQDLSGFVALTTGWSPLLMAGLPILISAVVGAYLIGKKG